MYKVQMNAGNEMFDTEIIVSEGGGIVDRFVGEAAVEAFLAALEPEDRERLENGEEIELDNADTMFGA